MVCRGSYSASVCTPENGLAVVMGKTGTQAGSVTFTNDGDIWGGISLATVTVGSTVTNEGDIVGSFVGGSGNDILSNEGTWTLAENFDFAAGTDSFTNSGTLIVRHSGSALAMNNLESFTLDSGGTLRFSLASNSIPNHALLSVGGATPDLAGTIAFVVRDSSTLPTSGSITLITGTSIASGTDTSGLSVSGAYGLFRVAGNSLFLDFARAPISTLCGNTNIRSPSTPGVANMEVVCDNADSLTSASHIDVTGAKIAIVFRGTQSNGSGAVESISNTQSGGEIHIESGSVVRTDTGDATAVDAVTLSNAGTDTLRLVMASGTSVDNQDTTAGSDAIVVSGGGGVSARIAGSTSVAAGVAISATAGGAGTLDLDITGGTHTSASNVVVASIASGGTGAIDIDITGGVLHGGSASDALVAMNGRRGADELTISSGVVLCSGLYSANVCTPGAGGLAISAERSGVQAGGVTITNAGNVWGGISLSPTATVGSTITNSGAIVGVFMGSGGDDIVRNTGTWTLAENFDFRGGTGDSFANSGTFIVHYDGTALAMNGLEQFTLQSGGTLRFSLGTNSPIPTGALLNIGSARATLAGTIDILYRDSSSAPVSGALTLITGTQIGSTTDISGLRVTGALGALSISGGNLVFSFNRPPVNSLCGVSGLPEFLPTLPGAANREIVCDSADSLTSASDVSVTAPRVRLVYRGTAADGSGSIRTISNSGFGAEIHILSGSVINPDRTTVTNAVSLTSATTSTLPVRFVVGAGASVANEDTDGGLGAIVRGGGNVYVDIAGSITTAATGTTDAVYIWGQGDTSDVRINITGGTLNASGRHTIFASIWDGSWSTSEHTGSIDIRVSGAGTVVSATGTGASIPIHVDARVGNDRVAIGAGALICRGSVSAGVCTQATGPAINMRKQRAVGGSITVTNAGRVVGDIGIHGGAVGSTVTNQAGGVIRGNFAGHPSTTGADTVSNAGTWTVTGVNQFRGGTDSFTNSGTLIVEFSGTTIAMNDLEAFTLNSGGTTTFSLAANTPLPTGALLDIGGATPTLAGAVSLVLRDSSAAPISGMLTLITGTQIISGTTDISGLTVTGAYGTFSISGNDLILTFGRAPASTLCGTSTLPEFAPTSPGVANRGVVCDYTDALDITSQIAVSVPKVKLTYRGTQSDGTGAVESIANTGNGGEIHIESGSVERTNDGSPDPVDAVVLSASGTDSLRLVVASGTSIANTDTSAGSDAVIVSGGGSVFIEVAGSTSAVAGKAISATASGTGTVDLDVTGGTHTGSSYAVETVIAAGGTGNIDIDVTGTDTVLSASGQSVLKLEGRTGADTLDIGTGVVVCGGVYSDACTQGSATAISVDKNSATSGSVTIKTAAAVFGDINIGSGSFDASVVNEVSGTINGRFSSSTSGVTQVTNKGTWTMSGDFGFGTGTTDSFTNSGTFVVHYDGTTLAMNGLETFTLSSGGTLRFSLADSSPLPTGALLNIGGATPTLAATIDILTRDLSDIPDSGTIALITGTALTSGVSLANLQLTAGLAGTFGITSNTLSLTLSAPTTVPGCGTATTRQVAPPGHANMEVVCDREDALRTTTDISRTDSRVAILYRGTRGDGSGVVRTISNTGAGGEIHIESGSVSNPDRQASAAAASLVNAGTDALRFVLASGASVSNAEADQGAHAISVSGGGAVSVSLAGDTSAVADRAYALYAAAGGAGDLDINITGGTHSSSSSSVVSGVISSGGTGAIDIDITGGVLSGGSATASVIGFTGRTGADDLTIGSGVVVCRGTYSAGNCTAGSGSAVLLGKTGTQSGSVTFSNTGSIVGNIDASTLTTGSTVTNNAGGAIVGAFTGGTGNDVLSNAGTWTIAENFDFGSTTDSDSFANSGTFIVHYAGSTLAMNNLETFTLNSGGTLRFSLGEHTPLPSAALLDIGGATPTLAGTIDFIIRDGSRVPTSGVLTLITGTGLVDGTDLSNLSLSGVGGVFSIANNALLLTLALPPADATCGDATARSVARPGYANKEVVCNSGDNLRTSTDILRSDARVAILYHGTQSDGSGFVNSITNTGAGGEIHIRSGSVIRTDDQTDTAGDAVTLSNAGAAPLRLRVLSGASVTNLDTSAGSDAIYVSGGGSVFVGIAGSTSAVGGRAIFAEAAGSGDVDLDVTGGTHTGASVLIARIASGGTGALNVDISGARTVLYTSGTAPLSLSGRGGTDTLDIGAGVRVCRGTYANDRCTPATGSVISVNKNAADSGSITITTAGRLEGDMTIGGGAFAVSVTNRTQGHIVGDFRSTSTGNTEVVNEGTWIMSDGGTFGSGTDSFTNSGTLVLKYAGDPVVLTGLETFAQSSGATLRIEIDPRGTNPSDTNHDGLPSFGEALFDVGRASGRVAGSLEVVILATIPRETLLGLLALQGTNAAGSVFTTGHNLDLTAISLSEGLERVGQETLTYNLERILQDVPVEQAAAPQRADDIVVALATDSLVQSSWFSTRAFLNVLGSSECSAEDASSEQSRTTSFLDGSCGWMNVGARFLTHDRTTVGITKTQEDAMVLSGGFQTSLGSWGGYEWKINTTAAYEFSNLDMGQSAGTGHRGLVGFVTSLASERMPINLFFGATVNTGTYELTRTVGRTKYEGDPEILAVAGHAALQYLFSGDMGTLGTFALITRLQGDVVGLFMDSFTQTNSGAQVGEVSQALLSIAPSVELRTTTDTNLGELLGWVELGLVGLPITPELDYTVSGRNFEGTMEQFLAEVSAGFNLAGTRTEFSLFWDGLFGFDTISNAITLKAKYAF